MTFASKLLLALALTATAIGNVGAHATTADCGERAHVDLIAEDVLGGELGAHQTACFRITVASSDPTLELEVRDPDDGHVDVGLYVRFGAPASTASYHCRSIEPGPVARCAFEEPKAGDWFVMLDAAAPSAYTLATSLGGCGRLHPGTARGVTMPAQTAKCFVVDVPADLGGLRVTMRDQTWLRSMWVRPAGTPLAETPVCYSPCLKRWPEPGPWIVDVKTYGTVGTVHTFELLAEHVPNACTELPVGSPTPITATELCYSFDVPPDVELLRVTGGVGRVARAPDGSQPAICEFPYHDQTCAIPGPETGHYYFTPNSWQGVATIEVGFEDAIRVTGAATAKLTSRLDGHLYRFDGPEAPSAIALAGGPDLSLAVSRGAPPTLTDADCVSDHRGLGQPTGSWLALNSGAEACALPAGNGPTYAFVRFVAPTHVLILIPGPFYVTQYHPVRDYVITGVPS